MARIKPLPDQRYLQECFTYNEGKLYWKERPLHHFKDLRSCKIWNTRFSGKDAGKSSTSGDGYSSVAINSRRVYQHRVIYKLIIGQEPYYIDHINGDRRDNRIENLRSVSISENQRNLRLRKDNTSGRVGISWYVRDGKWRAEIMIGRKSKHLGLFDSYSEAVAAREKAEVEYGFHQNHGN